MNRADDKVFGEIVRWLAKHNLRWREKKGVRFLEKRDDPRPPLYLRNEALKKRTPPYE